MTGFTALASSTARVNGPEDDLEEWAAIDWRAHEDNVRRLRQRIFKATKVGDLRRVRRLQKLMLRSRSNTLISVRQVTQRNAGRRTAGVDGEVALTPRQRMDLAEHLGRQAPIRGGPAGPAGVHPKGKRQASPSRHSCHFGPRAASTGEECAGARGGGALRAEILWIPAGAWLPRCDRGHLHDAVRATHQAPMDPGR